MECVRQDEGDGGKLWGAMRPHKTLGTAAFARMRQHRASGAAADGCLHISPHQMRDGSSLGAEQ